MTMLSFRSDIEEVATADRWAQEIGITRSELLRDALRHYLVGLAAEHDVDLWEQVPLSEEESVLSEIADWGPAEDWSDWADATR